MCGGTTKIPKIQKAAARVFDSAQVLSGVGHDEVITYALEFIAVYLKTQVNILFTDVFRFCV